MHNLAAELEVLEIEILAVRGLRLSPRTYLAEAAIRRERKIQGEIDDLKAQSAAEQNAVPDDDYGVTQEPLGH